MATFMQNMIDDVLGDGARASKFDANILFPNNALFPNGNAISVLMKSTQFPGKSHETIDLKFKGRSIPVKGQVKYNQTWSCTFYLTEDHKLKNSFEIWMEALDQKHNYVQDKSKVKDLSTTQLIHNTNGYTTTVKLYQRNFDDDQNTAEYTMENVYPTEISNIEYSSESVGQIQEFTVTFAYSHYTLMVHKSSESKAFIDELIDKGLSTVGNAINSGISEIQGVANNLAKDAIGSAKNSIQSAGESLGIDISSSLDEMMQSVSTSNNMQETIQSVQESGKGISLNLDTKTNILSSSAKDAIKDLIG